MARLIDADALRARMYHEAFENDTDMQKWDSGCWIRYKLFENCIDDMPTISPDEVRGVGHWVTEQEAIDAGDYSLRDTCSVCGRCDWDCTESDSFKYCPNCGARMKGASEDA
jgi:hypothetical protein